MLKKYFKYLLSILIGISLFFIARPVLAQFVPEADIQQVFVELVGSEFVGNDIQQIYYIFNNKKIYISEPTITSVDPVTDGRYVAWLSKVNGAWQVVFYDAVSNYKLQLSTTTNNSNLFINDGKLTWQGYGDGIWSVYLFDGFNSIKLSGDDNAFNPFIEDNLLVYSQKDINNTWTSVIYDITNKESIDISTGQESKKVELDKGKILLKGGENQEQFPLTAEDMFLLDF